MHLSQIATIEQFRMGSTKMLDAAGCCCGYAGDVTNENMTSVLGTLAVWQLRFPIPNRKSISFK